MTSNIGPVSGGSNYGVNPYDYKRKEEEAPQNAPAQAPVDNHEETQVDPNKVMEFMANNNLFVKPTGTTTPPELDPECRERVANSMERFEVIYGLISEEFGEELAPAVMDLVMDKLMGM